jgi:hypothetical protein
MDNSKSTESTPNIPPIPPPANNKVSNTSSSSPVIIPTPSVSSELDQISMDGGSSICSTPKAESEKTVIPTPSKQPATDAAIGETETDPTAKKSKSELRKRSKKKAKQSKQTIVDSSSSSDDSDADSELDDTSEDEKEKRKKKRKATLKKVAAKKKAAKEKARKSKSKKKAKKAERSDDSSDDSTSESSDSTEDSSSDPDSVNAKKRSRRKAKAKAKSKKSKKVESSSDYSDFSSSSSSSSSSSDSDTDSDDPKAKRKRATAKRKTKKPVEDDGAVSDGPVTVHTTDGSAPPLPHDDLDTQVTKVNAILQNLKMQQLAAATAATAGVTPPIPKVPAKKNAHEFKRVDQVWDTKLRDYKLIESTAEQKDEFECVFTVRRRFNWEGKLRDTLVDIKSKSLRAVLQEVLKECKCVSLVEDIPEIDPHILYHYYDEIKTFARKTLKPRLKRAKKTKDQKLLTQQIAQCKLLLGYVDEDFATTRKALKPLLKAGTITYELTWALFKPNTIVYTPTYGNKEDPRCFRVEQCFEYESWLSGAKSCCIDGKYLEYDGKTFGLGNHEAEIKSFKGHKKITSLVAYPLKYHRDPKVSPVSTIDTNRTMLTDKTGHQGASGRARQEVHRTSRHGLPFAKGHRVPESQKYDRQVQHQRPHYGRSCDLPPHSAELSALVHQA